MVSRIEVENAYRLILGREPESDAVVDAHAAGHATWQELRRTIIQSREFAARYAAERDAPTLDPDARTPLDLPAAIVQTDAGPADLERLVARIEREFTYLGETEPHWSVLTHDQFRAAVIERHEAEFFATGRGVVDDLVSAVRRNGLGLPTSGSCFELGCGLGRSTIWLAEAFARVIGADISRAHLALAQQAAQRYGKSNIEFMHVNAIAAFDALPAFDVFFSIIVLQHNPPPLIDRILRRVLRRLNPGGLGYFQIPTYAFDYRFVLEEYLVHAQPPGVPEMHVLPQPQLFRLLAEELCELIEIREEGASGPNYLSNRLLVRKRAA